MGPIPTVAFQIFRTCIVPSLPQTSSFEEPLLGTLAFSLETAVHELAVISLLWFTRRFLTLHMFARQRRFVSHDLSHVSLPSSVIPRSALSLAHLSLDLTSCLPLLDWASHSTCLLMVSLSSQHPLGRWSVLCYAAISLPIDVKSYGHFLAWLIV